MTTVAVLATGPSMSQAIADYVRGRCLVVAVCNAYKLAPWADALFCQDRGWWAHHKDAEHFAGRKFCGTQMPGTKRLGPTQEFPAGCNSGLQGMRVARDELGATRILLCGFDMQGTHYFGKHPAPLRNTSPERFRVFLRQFAEWKNKDMVINCTPGSALKAFRFTDLNEALTA